MRIIFIFILTLLTVQLYAQKGKTFPTIEGSIINGSEISIPSDTKGKLTLIGLAFSKKSDKLLKDWLNPIYTTFVEPPTVDFFPPDPYDINLYFIGLLKGLAKAADDKVELEMTKNLDPKLHQYTMVSSSAFKPIKKTLALGKKDLPYFFILDENGKILYNTEGAYTERKMKEIKSLVDQYAY
jgi:hypothetical protein